MFGRKKNLRYLTLTPKEKKLARDCLVEFYNKLLAEGKPTEDVAALILKLSKK